MFLLVLIIDHNSRMFSFIDDFKAERETVNNNNGNFINEFLSYIQL